MLVLFDPTTSQSLYEMKLLVHFVVEVAQSVQLIAAQYIQPDFYRF
jgi:hypothetical protein